MAGAEGGAARMLDLLLRWGANEEATSSTDHTAVEVVGFGITKAEQVAEDVDRVRKLLLKVSATRQAWLRRGLFVIGKSRPELLKLVVHGSNDGRHCQEIGGTDWIDVAARVLGFEEEGIFQSIIRYL